MHTSQPETITKEHSSSGRAARWIVIAASGALALGSLTVPSAALADANSISGTLHFPVGLDAAKSFGKVTAYDEGTNDDHSVSIDDYDPASGDATFELSGLIAGGGYIISYDGPRLDENPAAPGGFTGTQWSDGGDRAVEVLPGTTGIDLDIDATPYVSGILQFATGLDPNRTFGAHQAAGGSEEVRHDWIDWYGDYDPVTGEVPFIATDDGGYGSVNVTYPGMSGDPSELPVETGYLAVVWDGTSGGSTEWESVVGAPDGADDLVLDMRVAAGYAGTITLPPGFDPWAGRPDLEGDLWAIAEVDAVAADGTVISDGEILSYDEVTNSAQYVLNGIEPASYHPRVSPYDYDFQYEKSDATRFVPQLSNGAVTVEASLDPATALPATTGTLASADFTIPKPSIVSGTFTEAKAPAGGFTEGRADLLVDGKATYAWVQLTSTAKKPGSQSFALAVPTGSHLLALDAKTITYTKSYALAFSSHSVVNLGTATRAAGATYKAGTKPLARSNAISGHLFWDWPWDGETTPLGYYGSDLSGTVDLLRNDGAGWTVAYSASVIEVAGSRFQWDSIAKGTYKIRVTPDDSEYCPASYYGGPTLDTAKPLVVSTTTTLTKLVPYVSVECGALIGNGVRITGTQKVGATVTANTGVWTAGTKVTYAWYRGATKVSTSKTLKLAKSDEGTAITLKVTGVKSGYPTKVVTVATAKILATATPTITGTAKVGQTLTAHTGTWSVGTTLTYQWFRGSSPISDADDPTYALVPADKKKKVSVKVTGHLDGYATVTNASASKTIG